MPGYPWNANGASYIVSEFDRPDEPLTFTSIGESNVKLCFANAYGTETSTSRQLNLEYAIDDGEF
jgi:hypothetical protein